MKNSSKFELRIWDGFASGFKVAHHSKTADDGPAYPSTRGPKYHKSLVVEMCCEGNGFGMSSSDLPNPVQWGEYETFNNLFPSSICTHLTLAYFHNSKFNASQEFEHQILVV